MVLKSQLILATVSPRLYCYRAPDGSLEAGKYASSALGITGGIHKP
jgi:hypothetical protein